MTAETKGIPMAEELARLMGHSRYVTARKSVKAYMEDPLFVEDESITTLGKQRLYLMQEDAALTEALIKAGRTDLIGNGPECLIRPLAGHGNTRGATQRAGASGQTGNRPGQAGARGAGSKKSPIRNIHKKKGKN